MPPRGGTKKNKRSGVQLTAEEPQGQFQPADLSNQFADPMVMDLLSSMFQPQGGGMPLDAAGGALGGGDPQTEMLRGLMDIYSQQVAKQPTIREAYAAKAEAQNPVAWAAKQRDASLANPFGPGGYFEGRGASQMSPAAVLASQGPNAMNQWAQRGAVEGIDPEELKRLNEQTRLSRRSYT